MEFGFSYIGLIYLIMLFVPNIIWSRARPVDYEELAKDENPVLLMMERIGEIAVTCLALIFSDFNLRPWSDWSWWIVFRSRRWPSTRSTGSDTSGANGG